MLLVSCSAPFDPEDQDVKINTNGYEYVNLGLSTLWATKNIGANTPYQDGDFFAFEERRTKWDYTSDNYVGGGYDVAKLYWKGDWRVPTYSEILELFEYCSFEMQTEHNVDVVIVTGPNGNSIRIPFAGCRADGGSYAYNGLWSSSGAIEDQAYFFHWDKNANEVSVITIEKYVGFPIRAVMTNPYYEHSGSSSDGWESGNSSDSGSDSGSSSGSSSTYEAPDIGFYDYTAYTKSMKVMFQIYNQNKANVTSAKVYYGTSSPSKAVGATVSGRMITANISGLSAGTVYYVKCVAKGPGGSTTSETVRCITDF